LHEQLQDQKQANEENKQKMEQKFFVEKNKMEREVRVRILPITYFYWWSNLFSGKSQNWSIC